MKTIRTFLFILLAAAAAGLIPAPAQAQMQGAALRVVNHTGQQLTIRLSGRYLGKVGAGQKLLFNVRGGEHVLEALVSYGKRVRTRTQYLARDGYFAWKLRARRGLLWVHNRSGNRKQFRAQKVYVPDERTATEPPDLYLRLAVQFMLGQYGNRRVIGIAVTVRIVNDDDVDGSQFVTKKLYFLN